MKASFLALLSLAAANDLNTHTLGVQLLSGFRLTVTPVCGETVTTGPISLRPFASFPLVNHSCSIPNFLNILRCPVTGQRLEQADEPLVNRVNQLIADKHLRDASGGLVGVR